MKKTNNTPFSVSPAPANASDDGECIDFGTIGKHNVMAYRPGPEYKTELLIDGNDIGDFINLDITHLTNFNRFNVRFEAQSKADCLRNLRKLTQVVKAMPAVGIPSPQSKPVLAITERRAA